MSSKGIVITACLVALLSTEGLAAQATGLPTFFAPTRGFATSEAGGSLSRPGGGTTGIELRLGAVLDRADLAFRIGYTDPGGSGDGEFIGGVEARIPAVGHSPTFPLDGALIIGVGRIFRSGGGQTLVPLGLTLGRRISLDGPALQITPYAQPTLLFADDTLAVLGLGLDLRIRGIPDIRLGWGAGDMDGFSISLFWSR